MDNVGNFWFFGGQGSSGIYNDLWRYKPSTNTWTWIKGSNAINQFGTYGTQGIASASNSPGARYIQSCWTDNTGNFWIMGGTGYSASSFGYLTDLWKIVLCDIPNPPANTTPSSQLTLCSGKSTTLTANSSIGTILWYSSPNSTNAIASGSSFVTPPFFSTNTSTNYTYYLTSSVSCGLSHTLPLYITVNPQPTVSVNSSTICQGNSLTITPSGASTYTIQGGNTFVSPATTSNYTVTGTSTAGCLSSNTAIATVSVNPLPIITILSTSTLLCEGETATLTASGASSYSFSPGGAANTITTSPLLNATYLVTGTDANGCSNTASITQSVDACIGILKHTNVTLSGVEAYPNPTSGLLNLELNSDYDVIIINSLGQLVYSAKLNSGQQQINLEHLAKGMYVMRFNENLNGIKLLKE